MTTNPSDDRPAQVVIIDTGDMPLSSQPSQHLDRLTDPPAHVDRRIVTQVRILTVIAMIMLGSLIVNVAQGTLSLAWAAMGLLAGTGIGVIASRKRRMEWDDRARQVVARLDWIGAVILVAYTAVMLARDWILGHWAEGPALAALGLSVTAGALVGQVLGTRRGVRAVLEALGLREQVNPSAADGPISEGDGSMSDGGR
jgi:hypothetical protein